MTYYAQYDHSVTPQSLVLGWYDTGMFFYPNLPPINDLLELTQNQWDNRTTETWAVENGALVIYTPPSPPPPTQQQLALADLQAGVVQIVSISNSSLDGTYASDSGTFQTISGILAAIGAGIGLPGGDDTFTWADAGGNPHFFGAEDFKNLATAIMNFTYTLSQIIGGAPLEIPTQPVTIP